MDSKLFYRTRVKSKNSVSFELTYKDTDLFISCNRNLTSQAKVATIKYRTQIENYIKRHSEFQHSLLPIVAKNSAPLIIKKMIQSSRKAKVGPMASVAGAIAEFVGKELLKFSKEVIVENGGDIFLKIDTPKKIGIFTGASLFAEKLGIIINPDFSPCGVCTSSGTIGHSLSFGKANSVTVISKSCILADAIATACGNVIKDDKNIRKGLEFAKTIKGIYGIIIIIDKYIGSWGNLRLIKL